MAKPSSPKWYYDACALDDKEVYREITKKNQPNNILISFLALGEAYGNTFNKSPELAQSFVELIESLRDYIHVIPNEKTNGILIELMEEFSRLDAADALHLATAIHHKCEMVRTRDRDMYGIEPGKLAEFGKRHGASSISVSQVKP